MKKLFLLFTLVLAIGCGDNSSSVQEEYPDCNIQEVLNGRNQHYVRDIFDAPVYLRTGATWLAIDSADVNNLDSTLFRNRGVYNGQFTRNTFNGSFIDDNNTKHTVSIKVIQVNCTMRGEFIEENQTGEIRKSVFNLLAGATQ